MRWTGLILSIAIVGLTIGLFLATGSASTTLQCMNHSAPKRKSFELDLIFVTGTRP